VALLANQATRLQHHSSTAPEGEGPEAAKGNREERAPLADRWSQHASVTAPQPSLSSLPHRAGATALSTPTSSSVFPLLASKPSQKAATSPARPHAPTSPLPPHAITAGARPPPTPPRVKKPVTSHGERRRGEGPGRGVLPVPRLVRRRRGRGAAVVAVARPHRARRLHRGLRRRDVRQRLPAPRKRARRRRRVRRVGVSPTVRLPAAAGEPAPWALLRHVRPVTRATGFGLR
jgi:hypothetical protein